jgi:hypothetical protein
LGKPYSREGLDELRTTIGLKVRMSYRMRRWRKRNLMVKHGTARRAGKGDGGKQAMSPRAYAQRG